ncbi:MAG: phage integrase N-terminal SAM-like domain-containing protein [Bacillota bacterium]
MVRIENADGYLKVYFSYRPELVEKVRRIAGRRYDPEHKCWIIPNHENIVEQLINIFGAGQVRFDFQVIPQLNDLEKELIARSYSYKTIKAYIRCNMNFDAFIEKSIDDVTNEDIRDYLVYLSGKAACISILLEYNH